MTLTPILEAPIIIQLHLLAALPALLLGPVIIWGRRSRRAHRWLGYIWVAAMLFLAGSALFIPSQNLTIIGHFGPIHVLAVVTFAGLAQGIWHARHGRIAAHQEAMRSVWFWALGFAGLFTLLPGRILHAVLLSGDVLAACGIIALGIAVLVFARQSRARPFRSRGVFTLEKDQRIH